MDGPPILPVNGGMKTLFKRAIWVAHTHLLHIRGKKSVKIVEVSIEHIQV